MRLSYYLKQFNNIAWYPSAYKDSLSMVCLSYKSLRKYGISKDEAPDCFIFTDYETYLDQTENHKFFLELDKYEDEACFNYQDSGFSATAFNIKELERIDIEFDRDMVGYDSDEYYGRVFVADVLIEHPKIERTIVKLVYVITENTSFAFNYLIPHKIKVKYAIHSGYGHGFGGGLSNGGFMCNILKDLKTKYFASDIDNEHYNIDVADRYLSKEQRITIPILNEIVNFKYEYMWRGYEDTILYEVKGFEQELDDNKRFLIYEGNNK